MKTPSEKVRKKIGWGMAVICIPSIHLVAVVVMPLYNSSGSWHHLQDVLDRWQTFNTGMIGFYAAIATIAYLHRSSQAASRLRLKGSMMMLSQVLSELVKQNILYASYLDRIWERWSSFDEGKTVRSQNADVQEARLSKVLHEASQAPQFPPVNIMLFKDLAIDAIDHPQLVTALHRLTSRMQTIEARINRISQISANDVEMGTVQTQILNLAAYLIRNQAYVLQLFPFSRTYKDSPKGIAPYRDEHLTPEMLANSFRGLKFQTLQIRLDFEIGKLNCPETANESYVSTEDDISC